MAGVITIATLSCAAVFATVWWLRRKRAGRIDALENISVSREWLTHHRADDPS